ncbi:uncharacterized protein LOC131851832 [Achroia grisella]|uniref:uncharacterized protein LOC131851832 n=1 Tax=Achroia grisella TaxID=688607 RepID=UPI0027D209D9|nr:uncharacterized protein LOC131851832 [Achroia grisella]
MARCRSGNRRRHDPRDCIVFAVISEPPEDPLGLDSCEDIGYAYLYLGDMVSSSGCSDSYTEVVPVRSARDRSAVCGVLALRLDGLHLVRKCLLLSNSGRDFSNSLR